MTIAKDKSTSEFEFQSENLSLDTVTERATLDFKLPNKAELSLPSDYMHFGIFITVLKRNP